MQDEVKVVRSAEEDRQFREKTTELNEKVRIAELEYQRAKKVSNEKKQVHDALVAALSDFIANYGKPDPQAKLPFEDVEDDEDGELIPQAPISVFEGATAVATLIDDSPGIATTDLDDKTKKILADKGIKTVNDLIRLCECEIPEFPKGPEEIKGIGKKAQGKIAEVYAKAKFGDNQTVYDPPLPNAPEAVPPLAESPTVEVDDEETVEVDGAKPIQNDSGKTKIRLKIAMGSLKTGAEVWAEMIGADAMVDIDGEGWGLSPDEFEVLVA
jgi:hypothetical protein